jgi:hypothetical protein
MLVLRSERNKIVHENFLLKLSLLLFQRRTNYWITFHGQTTNELFQCHPVHFSFDGIVVGQDCTA